jgi:DNA invertase Pin-like site-specific DNA recombinase
MYLPEENTMSIPVPAAQYLRMSTDYQQYSLENQADAIARYAADHGFAVVRTYSDAARSGLSLKNRDGLKQLLKDVVEGDVEFRAILVYDVSRWGRFQDTDEAAHYEYLCKSSGVPVYYCAETFTNDGSLSGLILKALKRTMAGEYSRELSVKVRSGLARLAGLGYKAGGTPPYGLRRLLLDSQGHRKQLLHSGERKNLTTERVILVPGPRREIAVVRRIFGEFADHGRSLNRIATGLNTDGIPFLGGARWNASTVTRIILRESYRGTQVWGRTSQPLGGQTKFNPEAEWVVCKDACKAIVDRDLFCRAQRRYANLTIRLTNDEMLERLRLVLHEHGKLTAAIIDESRLCPGSTTYQMRFGGLLNAYARLGYEQPERAEALTIRQRYMLIRRGLIDELVAQGAGQVEELRRTRRVRARLRVRKTGRIISVALAAHRPMKMKGYWRVEHPRDERKRLTILALLNIGNTSIFRVLLVPNLNYVGCALRLREGSPWLEQHSPAGNNSELVRLIASINARYQNAQ